jgi:hypothetical protein
MLSLRSTTEDQGKAKRGLGRRTVRHPNPRFAIPIAAV